MLGNLLLGYFRNPEALTAFLIFRFRTTVGNCVRYKSLVFSPLTSLSSKCGVVFVRGGILQSSLGVVNLCFYGSWMLLGQLLEKLRNGTSQFPVRLSWTCSVAVTDFCGWILFSGEVQLATLVSCLFSSF